jgi:hypothetical protein
MPSCAERINVLLFDLWFSVYYCRWGEVRAVQQKITKLYGKEYVERFYLGKHIVESIS